MTKLVRISVQDRVAHVTIANPPLNLLGQDVRAGLFSAIGVAEANPDADVILITAAGPTWPMGVEIGEIGRATGMPTLAELCARIAGASKPVIAGLQGSVLGGGFDLALAATYRIAAEPARLGFPEIGLGLVPGGGGGQRMTRLAGAGLALRLLLGGGTIPARDALRHGLVDMVVTGDARTGFRQTALDLAGAGPEALPVRDRLAGIADPQAFMAEIAHARTALKAPHPAAMDRVVECVEAALLLPAEAALEFERAAHEDLGAAPESAGLRHAFLAERRAGRVPAAARAAARPNDLSDIVLAGGGPATAGLALAALGAGLRVTVFETGGAALSAALSRIATMQEFALAAGRITTEAREADWDRLAGSVDPGVLAQASTICLTAATPEATATALAAIARHLRPGAVLAAIAADSAFAEGAGLADMAVLAPMAADPAGLIGLQMTPPPGEQGLAEVVPGSATTPEAEARAFALARRLGRRAVRAGGGRALSARLAEALAIAVEALLLAGASPAAIDAAMRAFGFAAGPCEAMDDAGFARAGLARPDGLTALLAAEGWAGRSAGRGLYRYAEPGARGQDCADVAALIGAERQAAGLTARAVSAAEIRRACLAALANCGARMIEQGAALRPSDVDLVALEGLGFPRWRGGPMHSADQVGLIAIRKDLRHFAQSGARDGRDGHGGFWSPVPLFSELIKNGRRFDDLNRG